MTFRADAECDRCEKLAPIVVEFDCDLTDKNPRGWKTLLVFDGPEQLGATLHLCDPCFEVFGKFLDEDIP